MFPTHPFANPHMVGEEFDVADSIVTFSPDRLDADILYDIAEELCAIDCEEFATRIEMERYNLVSHEDYQPKLMEKTIAGILFSLLSARVIRSISGEAERVGICGRFGEIAGDRCGDRISGDILEMVEETDYAIIPVENEPFRPFEAIRGEQEVTVSEEAKRIREERKLARGEVNAITGYSPE